MSGRCTNERGKMRLYADSADLDAVIPMLQDGLIAGVTSNPSILERDGISLRRVEELYNQLAAAGASDIFIQATGRSREQLATSARKIADLGDRVIVKVPATADGFRVAAELISSGKKVLLTAVYSLPQAVFAASIQADYIAPYFGRLVDSGEDALTKVTQMNRVLEDAKTEVLVASVRSPNAAATLALNGVRHITADVPVLRAMLTDPVTEESAQEFERIADALAAA